jgi:Peroxidase
MTVTFRLFRKENYLFLLLLSPLLLLIVTTTTTAFQTAIPQYSTRISSSRTLTLSMADRYDRYDVSSQDSSNASRQQQQEQSGAALLDRRQWFRQGVAGLLLTTTATTMSITTASPAHAQIYLDPAMYGDQELRVSAVDTVRESVRRSILQNPQLAPAFYQLALIDALSYESNSGLWGPDGWAVYAALATKPNNKDSSSTSSSLYMKNLQLAAASLLETERAMRQKNAITLADAVAIAGAESIESIGGPILPVQLGRADHKGVLPNTVPLDLFVGTYSHAQVAQAFKNAGLTEREMTALLAGLFTLEMVEASRTTADWKQAARPKFREAGKLGRMSDFKRLTDEDIAQAELDAELNAELEDPDDGWYIADSFGTRESRFGQRLAVDDINEGTFNKYLQLVMEDSNNNKKNTNDIKDFGWTADLLLDAETLPTAAAWMKKYSGANLSFTKDLKIAYNAATQLGAQYTGGKYESLLKNKPRKSLNDDGLNLF